MKDREFQGSWADQRVLKPGHHINREPPTDVTIYFKTKPKRPEIF